MGLKANAPGTTWVQMQSAPVRESRHPEKAGAISVLTLAPGVVRGVQSHPGCTIFDKRGWVGAGDEEW
jgi:hypothetical protein